MHVRLLNVRGGSQHARFFFGFQCVKDVGGGGRQSQRNRIKSRRRYRAPLVIPIWGYEISRVSSTAFNGQFLLVGFASPYLLISMMALQISVDISCHRARLYARSYGESLLDNRFSISVRYWWYKLKVGLQSGSNLGPTSAINFRSNIYRHISQ